MGVPAAVAAVGPVANPPIEESCGLDITLGPGRIRLGPVLGRGRGRPGRRRGVPDALDEHELHRSGDPVRNRSPSNWRRARSVDDDIAWRRTGPLRQGDQRLLQPDPASSVRRQHLSVQRGRPDTSASSATVATTPTSTPTGTSRSTRRRTTVPDLVVYVTDGDPTAFDFNQAGDPFTPGRRPTSASAPTGSDADALTLDRAVEEANADQDRHGRRMLAVGVGTALNNHEPADRLVADRRPPGRARRRPRRHRQPQRRSTSRW